MSKLLFGIVFILASCQPSPSVPPVENVPIVIVDSTNTVPKNLLKTTPVLPLNLNNSSFANSTPNPPSNYLLHNQPTENTGPINPLSKSAVLTQDNGGQSGFFIDNNSVIGIQGIYANNTAYPGLVLNAPTISDTTNYSYLYAPTMKLGNGGCLEYSMDYYRGKVGLTYSYLRLFNFCNNVGWSTGVEKLVDNTFQNNYLRDFGYGLPQFTTEIVKDINNVNRVLLYNYLHNQWELIYTSQSSTNDFNNSETWSMFETHYTMGNCTITPPIVSSNIKWLDNNGNWNDLNYTNNDTVWGDCFLANSGEVETNSKILIDNSSWLVSSK